MKKYLKINKSPSFQQLAEQVKGKILSQSMDQKEREQVQTFRAGSLREALALVRREVGPDALILRQHREGYQVCVDVCLELPSAAADLDAVAEAQQESVPHSPRPVEPDDTHSQINAVSVDALVTQNPVTSISAEFNSQLESLGYSSYTIAALSSGQDLAHFRRVVSERLQYAHKPPNVLQGRYRLVGASGVGKSALLIKVLAAWVKQNTASAVAVLSTDQDRLAGTEALQLACQTLGVHMQECASDGLATKLAELKHKQLILVDSAAVGPGYHIASIAGLKDIWVCSAVHSLAHLKAQYQQVAHLQPAGMAITQTDLCLEGDALGGLTYELRIPLYWLGSGNRLPEGIEVADENSVCKRLLEPVPAHSSLAIAV
jgi:flagellar biosynthesis protein FlhF